MTYKNLQNDFKLMTIKEFKINLEISHRDTFSKRKINKLYKNYRKKNEQKF